MWSLIWRGGLLVLLPLLALELGARTLLAPAFRGTTELIDFYAQLRRTVDAAPPDYLFLGTSRVAAAVHQAHFDSLAQAATGQPSYAANLGKGSATEAIHYHGVRDLLARHPHALRGTTVFLGAPHGIPDQNWQERWTNDAWPLLLSPYLPASEIPRFVRIAEEPATEKVHIALARYSLALRLWPSIKQRLFSAVRAVGDRLGLPGARPDPEAVRRAALAAREAAGLDTPADTLATVDTPPAADSAGVDLATQGGIRTDRQGLEANRRFAQQLMEQYLTNTLPRREAPVDWDQSVLADLVRLIRDHGGEVALFNVPLTSTDSLYYSFVQGDRAAVHLDRWAARQQVPRLDIPLPTTDADFPDLRHLRFSLASTYTEMLFDAYQQTHLGEATSAPSGP